METFSLITTIIALVMGVILVVGFIRNIYNNRNNSKTIRRTLIGAVILTLLAVAPFQYFKYTSDKSNFWSYGDNTSIEIIQPADSIANRYGDSLSYHSHFNEVQSFKRWMEHKLRHVNQTPAYYSDHHWSQSIMKKYLAYQQSSDSLIRDVGHLFYALHMNNLEQPSRHIQKHLIKITNKDIPYFPYIQGLTHLNSRSWGNLDNSEKFFLASIEKGECIEESYAGLSRLYWYFHQTDKLEALVYNSDTENLVPFGIRRQIYFTDFDWADYWKLMFDYEVHHWGLINAGAAAILLVLWLLFLRKFDIYEPEKWKYVIATFFISVLTMQLLYPIHDFQWAVLHYYRPLNPFSDLMYITVSVGMVEEFVKILPLLIMIKFTKAVNEPFDYILYAAIGALGFAFMENVQYYYESPYNISIRGFYCYLGHMSFSALIGYGLMLAKYRGYNKYLMFSVFFLVAAFMHGFYDFWLIDWWGQEYFWVSYLVIILCIHLLIYFTNNTLNISNFYKPEIKLNLDGIVYFALIICVICIMLGFSVISYVIGFNHGKEFLWVTVTQLLFYMFFFLLSISAIRNIRGYVSGIYVPLRGLFPPAKNEIDLTGLGLQLSISKSHQLEAELLHDLELLNQEVQLLRRFVVDDNLNAYIAQLSQPVMYNGYYTNQLILIPHWDHLNFNHKKRVLTNVYVMESDDIIAQPFVTSNDLVHLGKLFSLKIT
ncbi:MAG: PrsW family intramembrane metalloprotease [Crocinitomicaceae bacterium]|nr:PrsW family intramembrane metalloprotease [Crocinitomicaceae bacterium]